MGPAQDNARAPQTAVHNGSINKRRELRVYDSEIFALLSEKTVPWIEDEPKPTPNGHVWHWESDL